MANHQSKAKNISERFPPLKREFIKFEKYKSIPVYKLSALLKIDVFGCIMITYGRNTLGTGAIIFEPVTVGFPSREFIGKTDYLGTTIGKNAVLRSGTVIYCNVTIGDNFSTGHNVIIRERTDIGDNTAIGTSTIIEGNCIVGNEVHIQSMVFVPTNTIIGDGVFIGPNSILTNDRYPPFGKPNLKGPVLENNATIGANVTILPGVHVGKSAAVAAGSIVTKDVPAGMLAIGTPARFCAMPKEMMRPEREIPSSRKE